MKKTAAPAKVAKNTAPAKKPAKAVAPAKTIAPAKKPEKTAPVQESKVVKGKKGEAAKAIAVQEVAEVDAAKETQGKAAKGGKPKVEIPFAVLLDGGKRLSKTIMFFEVDEHEEVANKKKVSSELKNLEKKPTLAIRHKTSLAEETQEELTERILKELEEQNLAFTREAATQICTRCNKNLVSPEFWVDKHLGYCEECAAILKLGQSKEARKVDYQMGLLGRDSLDEEDEDNEFMDGPDAADLKEAEEELAELDD